MTQCTYRYVATASCQTITALTWAYFALARAVGKDAACSWMQRAYHRCTSTTSKQARTSTFSPCPFPCGALPGVKSSGLRPAPNICTGRQQARRLLRHVGAQQACARFAPSPLALFSLGSYAAGLLSRHCIGIACTVHSRSRLGHIWGSGADAGHACTHGAAARQETKKTGRSGRRAEIVRARGVFVQNVENQCRETAFLYGTFSPVKLVLGGLGKPFNVSISLHSFPWCTISALVYVSCHPDFWQAAACAHCAKRDA